MKSIHTDRAPEAIGPYSQAVAVGNLIYTSGQIALVPGTGLLAEGGIEVQTRQVCQNLQAVLEEAGSSLEHAVKTLCLLRNIEDFQAFNAVYAQYFTGKPARSCAAVRDLPKGALIEIEVVAETRGG